MFRCDLASVYYLVSRKYFVFCIAIIEQVFGNVKIAKCTILKSYIETGKYSPIDWRKAIDNFIDEADDDDVFVGIDYHI